MSQVSLSNPGAASGRQRQNDILGKAGQDLNAAANQIKGETDRAISSGVPLIKPEPGQKTATPENSTFTFLAE